MKSRLNSSSFTFASTIYPLICKKSMACSRDLIHPCSMFLRITPSLSARGCNSAFQRGPCHMRGSFSARLRLLSGLRDFVREICHEDDRIILFQAQHRKMSERKLKKTILFFHPDLGIGGAERLIIDAAVGLQNRGHKVTIFTSHCDPKHCFDEARDGTARSSLYTSRI